MVLQRKNLVVATAVAAVLTAAAVQAQTAAQTPAAQKPKAAAASPKAAVPAAATAPAVQDQAAPPAPAMRPRMGQGPGAGMGMGAGRGSGGGAGMGIGRGFGGGFGGMMGGPGMQGPMMRGPMGRGGMPGMAPGARLMEQLNLTQAQKDQLKAIREQQQKDVQGVRERLGAARAKLRDAMQVDIPDEKAVAAAATALAVIQTEQFALQARGKAQRMKVFTPEQLKQLKDARDRVARIGERQMLRNQRQMLRGQRQMLRPMRQMRQRLMQWWRDEL